jgi:hypothetical protein
MSVRVVPVPRASRAQSVPVSIHGPGVGRTLWQRLADDRDLVELKLVVLAGVTLLAMAMEFYL